MSNGIQKIVQRLGRQTEQSLITETYSYLERSKGESGMVEEKFSCDDGRDPMFASFCSIDLKYSGINWALINHSRRFVLSNAIKLFIMAWAALSIDL